MAGNILILTNQFGEESKNVVSPESDFIGDPIAANSIVSNLTGATALPIANTYAAVSAKLVPTMLLTGFVSGAGVVAATDTVLQAIQKLDGNAAAIKVTADAALPSASFTDAAVSSKVLTGLAAGADTPITATDTILVALANLQAQIDAIP